MPELLIGISYAVLIVLAVVLVRAVNKHHKKREATLKNQSPLLGVVLPSREEDK